MRSDEHAAGLCRALSLPVHDGTVIFKSVPATWKSEQAQRTGFLPPALDGSKADGAMPLMPGLASTREDGWVGIKRLLLLSVGERDGGTGELGGKRTCDLCAGFGCSWCDDSVMRPGGDYVEAAAEEEGLWEAALRPS